MGESRSSLSRLPVGADDHISKMLRSSGHLVRVGGECARTALRAELGEGCPLSVLAVHVCSSAMRCSEESTAVNFWMDVLTFAKHKLPTVAPTRACGNFTAEPESVCTAASEE